jgi:hypothetical protein
MSKIKLGEKSVVTPNRVGEIAKPKDWLQQNRKIGYGKTERLAKLCNL